jgi:hypothetical protein
MSTGPGPAYAAKPEKGDIIKELRERMVGNSMNGITEGMAAGGTNNGEWGKVENYRIKESPTEKKMESILLLSLAVPAFEM